jgi:hypothetical protein
MMQRLAKGKIELISKFLNRIYEKMEKEYPNATKRKFRKIGYTRKIKRKMLIKYPNSFKYYFFSLVRRIGINEDGKAKIAPVENIPFWGPAMSNSCKVHTDGCPVDCIHNTHNDMLMQQRSSNYKQIYAPNKMKNLRKDERFNFWKRPELIKEKEKIFMNLGDAKNCTFEPKINKLDKDEDLINGLTKEELVQKRLHNREWVNKMGPEFKDRFPLLYKEGMCKFVKGIFAEGRYDKALNELKKAFNLEKIEAFFDAERGINTKKKVQPKQKPDKEEEKKDNEPKKELEKENNVNSNQQQNNNINNQSNMNKNDKKEQDVREDNFSNPKNREICYEVYLMIKEIKKHRKDKKQSAQKLEKELNMIEHLKLLEKNKLVETKEIKVNPEMTDNNHQYTFTKNKYFMNKKSKMCEFGNQCPSLLGKNSANTQPCPYAHYKSELKFEQEVNERIKLRKNLKDNLEKAEDPIMKYEWNPVGPIISCIGCSSLFEEKNNERRGPKRIVGGEINGPTAKGLCEYCRYHKRADIQYAKDRIASKLANEKILKRREEKSQAKLQQQNKK